MENIETSPIIVTAIDAAFAITQTVGQIRIDLMVVDETPCLPDIFPTIMDVEKKLFECARTVESNGRSIALLIPQILGGYDVADLFLMNRKTFAKVAQFINHVPVEEPRGNWTILGCLREEVPVFNGDVVKTSVELLVRDDLPDDVVYCSKTRRNNFAEGAVAYIADGGFRLQPINVSPEEFEQVGLPHLVALVLN